MDFFKSVFSEDPEPSDSQTTPTSPSNSLSDDSKPSPPPNPSPKVSTITNAWTFGSSLFKTLASKSESVIDTYRRDLEELSSGLKKETATIREVASRAVKDLPARLETGAAVAHESFESVGQAIDNIGSTVSEIIAHGKDSILLGDSDTELSDAQQINSSNNQNFNLNAKPYSRFDAQIRAFQCNAKTYCEEVDDLEDYKKWKGGFMLEDKSEEMQDLFEENGVIKEIYSEVVPIMVDHETFWSRYFYRVYRVKEAEEARAKFVKRAISGEEEEEEEELSWDVDDEDDGSKSELKREIEENDVSEKNVEKSNVESEQKTWEKGNDDKGVVSESKSDTGVDQKRTLDQSESSGGKLRMNSEEKVDSEGKMDNGGSCKDSDFSVVSSQPSSHEEEDLSWDEIEDIGSGNESKVTARGSPNSGADLRKRLSTAEEEEDLTWDIEDDDEPVKS